MSIVNKEDQSAKRTRDQVDSSSSPESQTTTKKHTGDHIIIKDRIMDKKELAEVLSSILDEKLSDIREKVNLIKRVVKENLALKEMLESQIAINAELENRLDWLECKSRASNIIFKGVQIEQKQPPDDIIKKLCQKFPIKDIDQKIVYVRTISNSVSKASNKNIVLAKFDSENTVSEIFKTAKILANTGISIGRDMPFQVRLRSDKLLAIKRELRRKLYDVDKKDIRISVSYDNLYIGTHKLNWHKEKGLLKGDKDGVEFIKSLHGVNISQVVTRLLGESKLEKTQNHAGIGMNIP